MARRKAPEPTPYETTGLRAAEDGDVGGTARFLFWSGIQIENIGFFGMQPEPISSRLRALATEIKKLAEFCDGYATASKAKSTKKGK